MKGWWTVSHGASDLDRLRCALQKCVVFTWDATGKLYRIKPDPKSDDSVADALLRWLDSHEQA
jgi:hypothetical protein